MKKKKKKRHRESGERLTRKQKMELAAAIYAGLVEGQTEEEIIEDLGVTLDDYAAAKKFLLVSKGDEEERLSAKERFARYVIEQERNVVDLTDLVNNLDKQKQYSACVGAIRMRAEIADKIISTGQTLGIIAKEPEKRLLLGGISVTEMKDNDLRKGVLAAIGGLSKMIDKYGATANMRELSPGPLHHGEAIEVNQPALDKPKMLEASHDKKNRAKSSARAAGRRRVK